MEVAEAVLPGQLQLNARLSGPADILGRIGRSEQLDALAAVLQQVVVVIAIPVEGKREPVAQQGGIKTDRQLVRFLPCAIGIRQLVLTGEEVALTLSRTLRVVSVWVGERLTVGVVARVTDTVAGLSPNGTQLQLIQPGSLFHKRLLCDVPSETEGTERSPAVAWCIAVIITFGDGYLRKIALSVVVGNLLHDVRGNHGQVVVVDLVPCVTCQGCMQSMQSELTVVVDTHLTVEHVIRSYRREVVRLRNR